MKYFTGERIMAFADLILDTKQFPLNYVFDADNVNFPVEGLRLLGIMGIMDPPRDEVHPNKHSNNLVIL